MICLALDFAGPAGQAAIAHDDRLLVAEQRPAGPGTVEGIIPFLMKIIENAGLTTKQIDLFAATTGPGSFTGIRAGLAAANGLALAVDRPVCGLSVFDAIALSLKTVDEPTLIALDGRRTDFFAQMRAPGGAAIGPPANIAPSEVPDLIGTVHSDGPLGLAGSAAEQAREDLLATGWPPDRLRVLRACRHVDIAGMATSATGRPKWTNTGPLEPFYGREPDARRPS